MLGLLSAVTVGVCDLNLVMGIGDVDDWFVEFTWMWMDMHEGVYTKWRK